MKYSIVVPVRNSLEYVKDCVQSVLMQNYDDFELIVSDNYSSEPVSDYVLALNHPAVRLIKPQTPAGMVDHFEFALSQTQGEWVVFLGADDGLQPYFFSLCDFLTSQACDMGVRVINSPRAYFFWEGCDALYGDSIISYAAKACFYKRNIKLANLNALIGVQEYVDLPQMYTTSLVHKTVIEKAKALQGGVFYTSLNPDACGAATICSLESHYLESRIPLAWVGTSPKSTGFQFSQTDSKGRDELKSILLSSQIGWHPLMGKLQKDGTVRVLSNSGFYYFESILQAQLVQTSYWRTLFRSKIFKLIFFGRVLQQLVKCKAFCGEQEKVYYDILKINGLSYYNVRYLGMPVAILCRFLFKILDVIYKLALYDAPSLRCSLDKCSSVKFTLINASEMINLKNLKECFWGKNCPEPRYLCGWEIVWKSVVNSFKFIRDKIVEKKLSQ